MATKVRKVSTSKLDDLFAQEAWTESRSGPSSSSSIKRTFPTMGSFVDMRPPSIQLPKNCSVLTPSGSSSSSFSSAETDDEYGYYDDFHEEPTVTPVDDSLPSSISRKCSSKSNTSSSGFTYTPYSSAKSLSYSPMALKNMGMSRSASSVLCLIEDHKADLTCRSFESFTASSKVNVCVSMAGIRIIQKDFSEIAEYKLRILIDDQEFIAWKSFHDFKSLGEACRAHMKQSKGRSKHSLRNTVHAWDDVLSHRSWWKRPNQIEFMMEESNLLEDFMKNLLSEIPCIEMLVEFVVS